MYLHQMFGFPTNNNGPKGHTGLGAILVGNLNNEPSPLDSHLTEKPIKKTELNYTVDQMDSTDMYRIVHTMETEYTFFSTGHGKHL